MASHPPPCAVSARLDAAAPCGEPDVRAHVPVMSVPPVPLLEFARPPGAAPNSDPPSPLAFPCSLDGALARCAAPISAAFGVHPTWRCVAPMRDPSDVWLAIARFAPAWDPFSPRCANCVPHPRPGPPPLLTRIECARLLLESNPACRAEGCAGCRVWCSCVETVMRDAFSSCSYTDMDRSSLFRLLTSVVSIALTNGFSNHTGQVDVDRMEDFSAQPAPSSPPLAAALAEAQVEANVHAACPPAPPIAPPLRFNADTILLPDDPDAHSPCGRATDDSSWSSAEFAAVLKLLADDLSSGALREDRPSYSSSIFLPPGVKPRVCIDLRPVNLCMRDSTVRYPAARDLAASGRRWFVKLDLKAAFKSVRVPACVDRTLGFIVGGVQFVYTCLPFGWSWSPEIFTAALREVLDPVRAAHVAAAIVAYVDDIAIGHDDPVECVRVALAVMRALRLAGFRVSVDKTFLRPVRVLRFLGMLVRGGDSPAVGICPSTVVKAWAAYAKIADCGCSWAAVRLWGLLSFAACAVPRVALYRNALDEFASRISRECTASFHPDLRSPSTQAHVRLMHDVCWALGLAAAAGLHSLSRPWHSRVLHLVTDASASGYAARLWVGDDQFVISGSFSVSESCWSSAARELLALRRALSHFQRMIAKSSIVWQSDSTAGVSVVSSSTSSSDACRVTLGAILGFLDAYDADLRAVWSPRTHVHLAAVDALSRSPVRGGIPIRFPLPALEAAIRASPTAPTLHHDPIPGACVAPLYSATVPIRPRSQGEDDFTEHATRRAAEAPPVAVTSMPTMGLLRELIRGDTVLHCVSSDFRMSTGLAQEIRRRWPVLPDVSGARIGDAVVQRVDGGSTIIHLVTKNRFFDKPTVGTLLHAVRAAAAFIASDRLTLRIRLPRVGCGLDGLQWARVRPLVLRELTRGLTVPILVHERDTPAPLPAPPLPRPRVSPLNAPCGSRWVGSHVTARWEGHAVFVTPSWRELADVSRRFLDASSVAPCVLMMVSMEGAAGLPALLPLGQWCAADVPLLARGATIEVQGEDGAWRHEPSTSSWRVRTYFRSPALSTSSRVLTRAELIAAMHASGFPPHPGPPRSIEELWSRAARADVDDVWPALANARALCAATPFSPPVVPTLRMMLEACGAPDSSRALAMMQATGWVEIYGPTAADILFSVEEIDRNRCESTLARTVRVATSMLRLATDMHISEAPYEPHTLDGLACAWVRSRLRLSSSRPIIEHANERTPSAPAVAADCSALAARMRRLFLPCPARLPTSSTGLGPISSALLTAHGSAARHDASPKRVVWGWELRWGLVNNPEVAELHPAAVAALCLMGATMWRSCYIRRLRRCDASQLPDGNIAVRWSAPHKTNRNVGDSLPSTPKLGFLACRWVLPLVFPFVAAAGSPDDARPLFQDARGAPLSYVYLTRVLRMLLFGLPRAESATLHGLRVGCDSELKALGVPDAVRDMMGWWKLVLRRMSTHYEAMALSAFYDASLLYGSQLHQSLAPGVMATIGVFGDERHVSFSEPIALFSQPAVRSPVVPVRDVAIATARHIMRTASTSVPPVSPVAPPDLPVAFDASAPASSLIRRPSAPPPQPAASAGPLTPASAVDAEAAAVRRALDAWKASGGPEAASGVRRCALCKQPGHNRRTCPSVSAVFGAPNVVGDDDSETDVDDPDEVAALARAAHFPLPRAPPAVGASLASLLARTP